MINQEEHIMMMILNLKTTTLKSNLCDYADAYVRVKGRMTITGAGTDGAARRADERDKGITFKNCECIHFLNA